MIFPRLFTCPTLITNNFKIGIAINSDSDLKSINYVLIWNFLEFEVNIVIILEDNHLITENFPIKIIRYNNDEQT